MADILEAVFKRHGLAGSASPGSKSMLCHFGNSTIDCSSAFVVGERSITSALLFLTAVTAASELDYEVLFYTRTVIQKFPVPVKESMTGLKPDSLKKIKFVYPKSLEELLLHMASLHELASMAAGSPSLVLVDGLDSYVHGTEAGEGGAEGGLMGEMSATAHLGALLNDTSSFLTSIREKTENSRGTDRGAVVSCRVIVSCHIDSASVNGGYVFSVLDRYFPTRCTLVQDLLPAAYGDKLQHEWQVCLFEKAVSGEAANGQKWHLVIHANGAMEFSPISKCQEPRDSDHHRKRV